jgi:hypothetical protein
MRSSNPYEENTELRPSVPFRAQHVECLGIPRAHDPFEMGPYVGQLAVRPINPRVPGENAGTH